MEGGPGRLATGSLGSRRPLEPHPVDVGLRLGVLGHQLLILGLQLLQLSLALPALGPLRRQTRGQRATVAVLAGLRVCGDGRGVPGRLVRRTGVAAAAGARGSVLLAPPLDVRRHSAGDAAVVGPRAQQTRLAAVALRERPSPRRRRGQVGLTAPGLTLPQVRLGVRVRAGVTVCGGDVLGAGQVGLGAPLSAGYTPTSSARRHVSRSRVQWPSS